MAEEILTLLVADIGGTQSRFALYTYERGERLALISTRKFSTQDHFCFAHLLTSVASSPNFLMPHIDAAVIAGPGPVVGSVCTPTNIAWLIDGAEVTARLRIRNVIVINDLMAQGYACLLAQETSGANLLDVAMLWAGGADEEGRAEEEVQTKDAPVIVVGCGTGCGKAIVLPELLMVLPSEGGNAAFPFVGQEEWSFSRYLCDRLCLREVTCDNLLSIRGFSLLYAYHGGGDLLTDNAATLLHSKTHAPDHAIDTTQLWYARFFGRMVRNFALDTMALNGVYILGGMSEPTHKEFLPAMHNSLTHSNLLARIPVYYMRSPHSGLYGAAYYATLQMFD